MGQARIKRQRREEERHGAPALYIDMRTGERKTGRRMPPAIEFIDHISALNEAEDSGERPTAKVPCNGCRECCWHNRVPVVETEERPEDLAYLDYEPDPEFGDHKLKKREDGACVHLSDQGCGVYAHRPRVCRLYDCRLYSMCGAIEIYDNGHQMPMWVPRVRDERDHLMMGALQLAAIKVSGGKLRTDLAPSDMAAAVMAYLPEAWTITTHLHQEFSSMTSDQRRTIATQLKAMAAQRRDAREKAARGACDG